jgi:TIR domain
MPSTPLLFVSHSSRDKEIADALVRLFRSALNLRPDEIRCSSVDGYRLPGGADTDEQLRAEILTAETLIGIISPHGMSSAYVLFELGARWGARKHLIPVLVPGVDSSTLKGPLQGMNALCSDSEPQLHQLVTEVAAQLGQAASPPAAYLADLKMVTQCTSAPAPPPASASQTALTLTDEQVTVIRHLAKTAKSMYYTTIASELGWNQVKTQHVIDVLRDAELLDVSTGEYGPVYHLSKEGRAYAVRAGLV